ncbi:dihydrolipoamide acetyltransferase family protein [Nocardioides mangrovi]|uniref:Dihydrolipoamide acetyltransferase component of pyruvate dehydrogenase complex n=1 Tax=Nocardioides mangrovi TaxID=2874580 RepID=A0ABS7UAU0_9ACTN|nr:dihydrolipoamide acetyltransferase family protein [Nocardioides mangrovi]MBZ5737927.1 2-oxo acid dehydrogenase subunit E2 [Nocardioides mangrovi]
MPEVAANATDAVLADWLVAENAEFSATDAIATVETEKAVVDVEAEDAGIVIKTLVAPGSQVEVGAPIAVLGAVGETVDDLDAVLAALGVAVATAPVLPERRDVPEQATPVVEEVAAAPTRRLFASPLARKIAKDAGLPIDDLPGTGPRGRILRRDVERALAARTEPVPAPVAETRAVLAPTHDAPASEIPHTRLRRAIASRLTESKQTAPHFYVRATVRADALVALRAEVNDGDVKVSVNDLVVKAVAAAHRAVPEMNVVWTPDAVRTFDTVDVAVAVATDRGLVTPVLRDVTSLPVSEVAARVRDLAARARDGRLKQDELEGGTISVTNLGMYGVEEFAAIINPPHAAILAVGAVRDEPVVEDGAVVPGKRMTVTLSVDHRPVDGVVAARWLAALTDLWEPRVRFVGCGRGLLHRPTDEAPGASAT